MAKRFKFIIQGEMHLFDHLEGNKAYEAFNNWAQDHTQATLESEYDGEKDTQTLQFDIPDITVTFFEEK